MAELEMQRMVNRTVLNLLNDLQVRQSFDEVRDHVQGRVRTRVDHLVIRGLEYLLKAGLVDEAQITAADEKTYGITAAGIRQITRVVRPDQIDNLVWGA